MSKLTNHFSRAKLMEGENEKIELTKRSFQDCNVRAPRLDPFYAVKVRLLARTTFHSVMAENVFL